MTKYVGRAYLDRPTKTWAITLEPHAMVEAKRVFPRIAKREMGTVHLADTPETARRLLWFAGLCPIEFEPLDHVQARAAEFMASQNMVERILGAGYEAPLFSALAIPPREYQRVAAALALESKSLLLGDEVGLGKTVSAIAMLSDPATLPAVYVTLTALPLQVQESFARFAPKLRTHVLKTAKPYDLTKKPYGKAGERIPMPDVIITSWSKLAGWAETLAKLGFKTVVFDEAHELRHPGTERYNAAAHLSASVQYRLGMTGTITFGMASQVYWVMSVIKPDCLGTWDEFRRERCGGETGDKPAVEDPDQLGADLRAQGLMLRRTRAEVGNQLPPMQRIHQTVESDEGTLNDVSSRAVQLAIAVLEASGSGETKMRAAGELDLRLRQATGIGKARYVAEFVAMLVEAGEKVLLYGWHHSVYAIWQERLAQWKPAMYTGEESINEKRAAVKRFVDPHSVDPTPILIMSLRSGAGLDGLQGGADPINGMEYSGCSVVVFGELDWSPAVMQQAEGRVFRDGQRKNVMVYYLVSDSGSDPVIGDSLNLKASQLQGVNDPGSPKTMKVPDQAEIKTRMKRLAAAYLQKHDPKALAKIPGAAALLAAPTPAPVVTMPPVPTEPAGMSVTAIQAVVTPVSASKRPVMVDVTPVTPSQVTVPDAAPPMAQEAPTMPAVTPTPKAEVKASPEPVVAPTTPAPAQGVLFPMPPKPRRLGVRIMPGVH